MRPSGPFGRQPAELALPLVDDPTKRPALAPLYQHAMAELWKTRYKDQPQAAHADPDAPESSRRSRCSALPNGWPTLRVSPSTCSPSPARPHRRLHLPCRLERHAGRPGGGRGECPTALPQFFHPTETLEILGVPDRPRHSSPDGQFRLPDGDMGVAQRRPVHEVAYRNTGVARSVSTSPNRSGPARRTERLGLCVLAAADRRPAPVTIPSPLRHGFTVLTSTLVASINSFEGVILRVLQFGHFLHPLISHVLVMAGLR